MRNEELFRQVADAIEAHPEQYDQNEWCGTTACVAGWAVALSEKQSQPLPIPEGLGRYDLWAHWRPFASRARALLGLSDADASTLFDSLWEPHDGLSVPDALRKIGEGAAIEDVSA